MVEPPSYAQLPPEYRPLSPLRRRRWLEIVLAAVLVLAVIGILWPVSGGERPMSSRTACTSRLKQVGLGFIMYSGDFDEVLPPVASRWMDIVGPYIRSDEVLHCPEVKSRKDYGYAAAASLAGRKMPADSEPMAFDSTEFGRSSWSDLSTVPRPGRHGGLSISVFTDGRIVGIDENGKIKAGQL